MGRVLNSGGLCTSVVTSSYSVVEAEPAPKSPVLAELCMGSVGILACGTGLGSSDLFLHYSTRSPPFSSSLNSRPPPPPPPIDHRLPIRPLFCLYTRQPTSENSKHSNSQICAPHKQSDRLNSDLIQPFRRTSSNHELKLMISTKML